MPGKELRFVEAEMSKALPFSATKGGSPLSALVASGNLRTYRKGTYLCHQGEDAPDVFFLLSGRLEVSSVSPNGTRMFHASMGEPQFVGELGALGEITRTASVVALVDSQVWVGPADEFVQAIAAKPAASRVVMRALARQVQAGQAFVDDLLFLDLKGRVAKRLLQMVTPDLDQLPSDRTMVPDVTQADLASLCGGSRENVARILKELERRGLIRREGHRYLLLKVAGLAKIADL
jgi:CRP/FNR family transcriptional regulator, cyclic AMP receptor protein